MKADKDLYRQLRSLPGDRLWSEEVARFDQASPKERNERVAVIRAVGVVFSGTGTAAQKAEVRAWLVRLLQDPSEKVRRYAMAAIPKIRAVPGAEEQMISLLQNTTVEREKKYVGRALDKIGGSATLKAMAGAPGLLPQTEQKVKASVARAEQPSAVRLDRVLTEVESLRIHLRCRKGLQDVLRDEVEEAFRKRGLFRIVDVRDRYVAVSPTGPFSLNDLFQLRCFASIGFALGIVRGGGVDALARLITSPLARHLMSALTEGSLRYRLDYVAKGHQRGAVHQLANRAYELCPELLNDARSAPWSMDVHDTKSGTFVELRPRISPDPRMGYRLDDVAAASHPPLAAAMARLAGLREEEIVWDPFCGSGLELIERALRGGVKHLFGTDVSAEAIAIAKANVAAAELAEIPATFASCDFREYAKVPGLGPGRVTLVITNPPMGRRIRVPDLRGLIAALLATASTVLKPGGRLVFANPLRMENPDPTMKLQHRQLIDLGGFDCRLELYEKLAVRPDALATLPIPETSRARAPGAAPFHRYFSQPTRKARRRDPPR